MPIELNIPKNYHSELSLRETEVAIKLVKDHFEQALAHELNLTRVSAPLFVQPETGLNDNLNGVERPVSFDAKFFNSSTCEVVQSLAKWKRQALKRYGFSAGEGLYTDMNAIRRDEKPDNLHSLYVDQWDWECVITREQRSLDTLKDYVRRVYRALLETEAVVVGKYPMITAKLSPDIVFVTTQELENLYPDMKPADRETAFVKKNGSMCLMQIGGKLESGVRHDGRAPDYDDWTMNADIVLYYPMLSRAFEISSMGVRVDAERMMIQLNESGEESRQHLPFHRDILTDNMPLTIGGGIGQSRICMYLLDKAHVGEVQVSIWPDCMRDYCEKAGMILL